MDVLAQPFVEDLLGYFPAKRVGKHPVGKLIVPAQAVASHLHAMPAAEVGYAVGPLPGIYSFARMNGCRLHGILGGGGAEVGCHQFMLPLLAHVGDTQSHSDVK